MKPTPSPQDEEIIEILKSLGTLKAEYPAELLAARRAAFIAKIEQHRANGASKEAAISEDRVIELLEGLKSITAEYPAELLAARRAGFIAQIRQRNEVEARAESPSQDRVIELLGNLKSANDEYPSELLAARRAAFAGQIRQHNNAAAAAETGSSQNGKILKLFERLRAIEIEYPLKMWSSRRSAFVAQIRDSKISVLDALRAAFRTIFDDKIKPIVFPSMSFQRISVVIATLLLVAFVGSLAYGKPQPITQIFATASSQGGVSQPSPVVAVTSTGAVAEVICKPGYLPPLCLAQKFDKSQDLTFSGNGSARPAVAKDTIPGYSRIHKAAFVNDGLYGPGASWISNSAYSWIKIDLGGPRTINTITFGRDRLGNFNDGDPGQFIVAVALSDDIYADGNSHNDYMEYTQVYNSDEEGFDGVVSGPETIEATFDPVMARYVKITFENARTAVDEIEVFMIQPLGLASHLTQRPKDTVVAFTFTPVPTNTLVPSRTPTRIPPTNTLLPTYTATPRPTLTFTPRPTNTEVPTNTPVPPTSTPRPPTDTPQPPTNTPEPPTNTPVPPTDPPPTNTPVPPTDPPPPPATNTAEASTATSEPPPQLDFTDTPQAPVGP